MERRIMDLERLIETRFEASEAAVMLGRENLNTRLEHSNGLIEQMREQARDMVRQVEMRPALDRIRKLEESQAASYGQKEGGQTLRDVVMLVVAAVIAAVVAVLIK
jgi:hypothetical protein